MTSRRCNCAWRTFVVALGAISIISGIYLYLNWIEMFTRMRGKEMALSPTSRSFPDWKVSPLPLNFDVYIFNWTNPSDFYVGSPVKPHFEQLGPYRFREAPDKVDIVWHPHNATVSFRKKAWFYFDAAGSRGSLTDLITTVNTVAHSAALRAKGATTFQKSFLKGSLSMFNEKMTVTKTADQLMFAGYLDPLVTAASMLAPFSKDIEVPYDRVGWFYTRNGSATFDGDFNVYTGADDIYKMGQMHAWNNQTHNGRYEGVCGEVRGSTGEFFPPNLSTNDTISLYLPNMCRSVPLDYTETVEVHGVKAYKFSGGRRSVDNGTAFPETRCFCVGGRCEAAGVINIGPCKYNSSIYMSYPHFYQADPSYLEAVSGLRPDRSKHEFFMALEPNSGLPMDVGGGFQANYLLEPVADFRQFRNIPRTFIPLMWCEERVRVTPAIASDIAMVPLIILLGQIFTGCLFASGVIFLCWYPTKLVTQLCHDPKTKTKTAILLNPLSSVGVVGATAKPQLVPLGYDHRPLLAQRSDTKIRANGTVTESLLGNTLRSSQERVIGR